MAQGSFYTYMGLTRAHDIIIREYRRLHYRDHSFIIEEYIDVTLS